jgi:CRISPR-associated endonuclease/helicase Cas3
MTTEYWAKSPSGTTRPPTVVEHCRHVCEAAAAIWAAIGHELGIALGIDHAALQNDLYDSLRSAALLHDFAKVNSSFQNMLLAKPSDAKRQPVRHEILAAWLLSDSDMLGRWWSAAGVPYQIWPIIWAIAGHHRKMGDPARLPADPRQPKCELFVLGSGTKTVAIPLAACAELLGQAAASLGATGALPQLADLTFDTADDDEDSLQERINGFANLSASEWSKLLRRDPTVKRRTALLKAMLIAADVAASALIADGRQPIKWASDALRVRMTADALQKVVDADLEGKPLRKFQSDVGASETPATIVVAGCGNGKTTAAYLWGKRHAAGLKLWFTYPTTGTASAGYEGYLFAQKEIASDLFHSRSEVDLRAMQRNGDDWENREEEQFRLESLRAWDRQAIVCTVDTVLGLLQTQRRPLFSFPVIAAGAFVFDEIHSYDARLFGELLRFLETFPGVPVLLMSASIPPRRLEELKRVLGDRVCDVIRGDSKLEGYERYRLEPRDSAKACRDEVRAALQAGRKVLWVCNTVGEAVETARQAREWVGVDPSKIIIYHGRFRYRDRVSRQTQVINEFAYQQGAKRRVRAKAGAALVVATQVCEMSLDISADLMVTAQCPLPSFVQRLGRLNRYAEKDDPWSCMIFPFQGLPYNEDSAKLLSHGDYRIEMAATRKAVSELAGQPCNQRELARRLDEMVAAEEFEKYSAWLDDGWLTEPASVREGDNSITVIREEDLAEIEMELGKEHAKPTRWTNRSLVPWTIPMQHRRGVNFDRRAGGYPVAPAGSICYSIEEGAEWQMNSK